MSPAWSLILDAYSNEAFRKSKVENGMQVRIDNRTAKDVYQYFCEIKLTIHDLNSNRFELELRHPPLTEDVRQLVLEKKGEVHEHRLMTSVRISLAIETASLIVLELAAAIRAITRQGEKYGDRNWKWICPRTADSLDKFARFLIKASRLQPRVTSRKTPGLAAE